MKNLTGNQGPRNKWASYIDWSEDRVQNWQVSSPVAEGTNECQVVELADGTLMLNMRNYQQKGFRAVSISRDRGRSWARPWVDQRLIVPVCQASFLRCTDEHHNDKNRLLFANPADTRLPWRGLPSKAVGCTVELRRRKNLARSQVPALPDISLLLPYRAAGHARRPALTKRMDTRESSLAALV